MVSITLFPLIFCFLVFDLPMTLSFAPTGIISSNVQRVSSTTPFPPLSASSIITSTGSKKKVSSSTISTTALTRTAEAVQEDTDKTTMTTTVTATATFSSSSFQETAVRSAVKALMWRIIAGSVTFLTTLRFSNGSVTTALSLVGSDFLSKLITMFIGERIMNRSSAGRNTGKDSTKRSLIKALTWRLFAICNTLTMAIFISKDWTIASKVAGSDAILKTMMMFVYERAWSQIQWGATTNEATT